MSVSGYDKAVIITGIAHCRYVVLASETIVTRTSRWTATVARTLVGFSAKIVKTRLVAVVDDTTAFSAVVKFHIRFFDAQNMVRVVRFWIATRANRIRTAQASIQTVVETRTFSITV